MYEIITYVPVQNTVDWLIITSMNAEIYIYVYIHIYIYSMETMRWHTEIHMHTYNWQAVLFTDIWVEPTLTFEVNNRHLETPENCKELCQNSVRHLKEIHKGMVKGQNRLPRNVYHCLLQRWLWTSSWHVTRAPSQSKNRLSRYRLYHYKYNGNSYMGKTSSLYWDPQLSVPFWQSLPSIHQ